MSAKAAHERMFVYPITIISDRYSGTYSHAKWTAWNVEPEMIPDDAQGDDTQCWDFWDRHREGPVEGVDQEDARDERTRLMPWEWVVGFGATPNEAELDLRKRLFEKLPAAERELAEISHVDTTIAQHAAVGPCLCGETHNPEKI